MALSDANNLAVEPFDDWRVFEASCVLSLSRLFFEETTNFSDKTPSGKL